MEALCRQSDVVGVTTRSSCEMELGQSSDVCCGLVGTEFVVAVVFFLDIFVGLGRSGGLLHLKSCRSGLFDRHHVVRVCVFLHGFERVQLASGGFFGFAHDSSFVGVSKRTTHVFCILLQYVNFVNIC